MNVPVEALEGTRSFVGAFEQVEDMVDG